MPVPVTRLLGQSPAGLSATGDSDTRNYYDMVSAKQEADLRPKLERLDRLIARSEGLDPGALTFAFRPLWQLDAATAATVAPQKAQATQIYAGLDLWPAAVTARLVAAQLAEDGTYPNAAAVFAKVSEPGRGKPTVDYSPDQPRDEKGRWTATGGGGAEGTPAASYRAQPAGSPVPSPPVTSPTPGSEDPSVAAAGPHAPDGTPIELAAFKHRGNVYAKAIGALLGAAARLIQRWRPEEPDDAEPTLPKVGTTPAVPTSLAQTEKNKLAQSRDSRIRSDLADTWIKDDGTLNWPPNDGSDGPETSLTLQPGQMVDKYGDVSGNYLSPQATPFPARSLPYNPRQTPLRTFRVLKPFVVDSGRVAPWFDEPGGGVQFRTSADIRNLLKDEHLKEED